MPFFSVLMTNYNNSRYIDEAIHSVLSQTLSDWELIIVEDGSTDDSLEQIEKYLDDPRIRLYRLDRNMGYTKAQVFGLQRVNSEIIGILDSDDALLPQALEKAWDVHMKQPDIGLVLSQIILCDSSLSPLTDTVNTEKHLQEPMLWLRGVTHFRTFKLAAYKKALSLDTRLKSASDMDLIFKIEEVAGATRINVPLLKYRKSAGSLSQAADKYHTSNREAALTVYRAYRRRLKNAAPNVPTAWVQAWISAAVRYSLELGEPWQALAFALRSLILAPFSTTTYRLIGRAIRGLLPYPKPQMSIRQGNRSFFSIRGFQNNTGAREPDRITCVPQIHKPGHALYGDDYTILTSGRYRVFFELEIRSCSFAQSPFVILDVYENLQSQKTLAEWPVTLEQTANDQRQYSLDFKAEQGQRVEFRVFWREQCYLTINGVVLEFLT